MNRIGIFTGRLYSQEDYNEHRIHECALVVNPSENGNGDEQIKKAKDRAKFERILNCVGRQCHDCEESKMS